MDETLLREILKVQTAILAELRLLRRDLAGGAAVAAAPAKPAQPAATAPQTPAAPTPAHEEQPVQPAAAIPPEPVAPPARPAQATGSMLTVGELTDLGGQFLEPGQMTRTKVTPVEASDLLRDIKAKNRAKREAFAEFNKFGRDR